MAAQNNHQENTLSRKQSGSANRTTRNLPQPKNAAAPSFHTTRGNLVGNSWFVEKHTPYIGLALAVKRYLHSEQSLFQRIEVLESYTCGRVFLLDGYVMLTERDEFIYHEMITHPGLLSHAHPHEVLVIGGGDGGSVREILRYRGVERVHLVEIDPQVCAVAQEYFPALAESLSDPRVRLHHEDGSRYLEEIYEAFDVIVVDTIDPVGESAQLFTSAFYKHVRHALRSGGVAVFQTESPFYHQDIFSAVRRRLQGVFQHVAPYVVPVPTYPGGVWSFMLASEDVDVSRQDWRRAPDFLNDLRYFNLQAGRAAFVLPNFLR